MYINSEYVRHGNLELDKLFNIEDVTEVAISKQNEIKEKINEINEYMKKYDSVEKEPEKNICMNCFNPYSCAYWNYCTKDLPKNNVFNIRLMHKDKKFKLYNEFIFRWRFLCAMERIQYYFYGQPTKCKKIKL